MGNKPKSDNVIEKIVSLAKRKGFVFQSSEIYGGLNGCWDYGPLGVELLNNIKQEWWKSMTYREDVEGLDASILMHPRVWEASGHVDNFTDPMIDCKQCKARFRVDTLGEAISEKKKKKALEALKEAVKENVDKVETLEEIYKEHDELEARFETIVEKIGEEFLSTLNCPNCGTAGSFTSPRKFNLMFNFGFLCY